MIAFLFGLAVSGIELMMVAYEVARIVTAGRDRAFGAFLATAATIVLAPIAFLGWTELGSDSPLRDAAVTAVMTLLGVGALFQLWRVKNPGMSGRRRAERREPTQPRTRVIAAALMVASAITLALLAQHSGVNRCYQREIADAVNVGFEERAEFTESFSYDYTGPVWIRITPSGAERVEALVIRWGPHRYCRTRSVPATGVTFVTTKSERGQHPITVSTWPRGALVEFGTGVPDGTVIDINHKWR